MPIKILHFPGFLSFGGVGSVVMNLYRNMDRNRIQFDFCVPRNTPGPFDEEINKMGGRVFYVPQMKEVGLVQYSKVILRIIQENGPYDSVHIHSVHMGAVILRVAKYAGIRKCIYHVHNTKDSALNKFPAHFLLENVLNCYIRNNADIKLACGRMAGLYVYGKRTPFIVINNAVELSRFKPDEESRNIVRKQFGICDNHIVVGDIARFVAEKNQSFFLELAKEDIKKDNRCIFMLVGEGPLLDDFKARVTNEGLNNKFILTGPQSRVEDFYNSMDVFCLPSLYEGLPVTMMEAQACGLPCLLSTNVTDEGIVGSSPVERLDLNTSTAHWIQTIYSLSSGRQNDRQIIYNAFSMHSYEISVIAREMSNIYMS